MSENIEVKIYENANNEFGCYHCGKLIAKTYYQVMARRVEDGFLMGFGTICPECMNKHSILKLREAIR